ncbi:MAG TPA: CHASE3 domain-containing protein [Patescibacteria group bacterium]|nr:CHASE3 domain-containing protein [Patescibacteria group bacterium]
MNSIIYSGIKTQRDTTEWVHHSDSVLVELEQLLVLMGDIETSQRGYIITGESSYLQPYMYALPMVWTQVAMVQRLTSDNNVQQANIRALKPLIRSKIEFVEKTIAQRDSEGFATAVAMLKTGKGRILMDSIRSVTQRMEDIEEKLLEERMTASNQNFATVQNTIIGGSIIALSMVLITGGLITYTTTKSLKELLRGTEYLGKGNLAHRVHVTTKDEFSDLASAFNAMAERLQVSQHELYRKNELLEKETAQVQVANIQMSLKNDQLKALDAEKNEILGIVIHDLKNPLSGIKGLAQILEKECATLSAEEVREFSSDIRTSADRMFDLITNLLDINRIERGGIHFEIDEYQITPIVEHVFKRYAVRAQAKAIKLHFSAETSARILTDHSIMLQVLDNILSNAVKYSPFNKNIYVRVFEPDVDNIRIEIRDEGPGFTDTDKQKLFGKFARLSAQPTGGENSTGLGLSIVKKLVDSMKGKIWCESEFGHGATFILEFPKSNLAEQV